MIRSIEKVKVTDISSIRPFNRREVDKQDCEFEVYLVWVQMVSDDRDFRLRNCCHIGRAAGSTRGVKARLLKNYAKHEEEGWKCGSERDHFFQVLSCKNGIDAGRLEALFHLWHGRYFKDRLPIEPRGEPRAKEEPDFFVVESR